MNERSIHEQIVKYMADIHSIEQQALVQIKIAPKIAGDATLEAAFEKHIGETEDQKRRVDERLEALGGSPSKVKDVAGAATAPAFALFARLQPDTPGKLVSHAFSYEHMELAAYELLSRIAQRANDRQTVELAKQIAAQESEMARRLSDNWDVAVSASLRDKDPDDLGEQLNKYLSDAHAIESQAELMLSKAIDIGGDPKLSQDYEEHLAQTRHHKSMIEERLEARGASSNFLKDAAMKLGALRARSSRPSRTRQRSSPASPTRSSTWRSPRTSSYGASQSGPATSRWRASPRGSCPRSGTRRRHSGTASTGRSTHRSRAWVSPPSGYPRIRSGIQRPRLPREEV